MMLKRDTIKKSNAKSPINLDNFDDVTNTGVL